MNRWMLLRILVLGGGFWWAVWSLRSTPSVDLLADSPLQLLPPPNAKAPVEGDAGGAALALLALKDATRSCGATGKLKLYLGKGLEKAEWLGKGDSNCLIQQLWSLEWPSGNQLEIEADLP